MARLRNIIVICMSMAASCALPRPPLTSTDYDDRCPRSDVAPAGAIFVLTTRLPDCRTNWTWTDFRSQRPLYAFVAPGGAMALMTDSDWLAALRVESARLNASPVVFIHGYKTSSQKAELRANAIAHLTQWRRPIVAVTWPSYAKLTKYFWDEANSDFAKAALVTPLRAIGSALPGTDVIAHSMGNHLIVGLAEADQPPFRQFIMASPDVDRARLATMLERPSGLGAPTVIYASLADQALSASWRSHGMPRAGDLSHWVTGRQFVDVYAHARNAIVVDTTASRAGRTGHAAFIESESGAADLCQVLNGVPNPAGRTHVSGPYWRIADPVSEDECLGRAKVAVAIANGKSMKAPRP